MGDDEFVATLCDDNDLVQILKQLFVVADGKNDGGAVAVLVREILQGPAHRAEATLYLPRCRETRAAPRLYDGPPSCRSSGFGTLWSAQLCFVPVRGGETPGAEAGRRSGSFEDKGVTKQELGHEEKKSHRLP